ncbi:hypothetical protein AB7C87_07540 [Natrarchaeobius sp. A-rgal3]|uniref:hypothetical protein n=1 Tax=Natrarchaeobius versutus TaxID=1679078 RepID=UPI00350FE86A
MQAETFEGESLETYEYVTPPTQTEETRDSPNEIDTPEITLPSGASFLHKIEDSHERKHGWEQIVELPGVNQPEDLEQIIEAPNVVDQDGRYDLIIGDNPGGPGQIALSVYKGILISASIVETYPDSEYGDHSGERSEDRTVLKEEQWRHIQNDHDVTREEIRRTIENPDELWVAENADGIVWYMWVKVIDGKEVVVRGAYVDQLGEVRIGTSFKPERGYEYVQDWIQGTGANQIYP